MLFLARGFGIKVVGIVRAADRSIELGKCKVGRGAHQGAYGILTLGGETTRAIEGWKCVTCGVDEKETNVFNHPSFKSPSCCEFTVCPVEPFQDDGALTELGVYRRAVEPLREDSDGLGWLVVD